MLTLILTSALTFSAAKGSAPWFPFVIPISTGGGHFHKHTTHVVTHPITHTRVLVLGDDEHHHHHQHNHGHNHLHKHGHDHQHSHKHGHHHKHGHNHSHLHIQGRHHNQRQAVHQHRANNHVNDHANDQSRGFKYSIPLEESPWKPIIKQIPDGYLPLKYLADDEERVSKAIQEAMKEVEKEIDRSRNLILPVGIKKLHNPQLRRPPSLYNNFMPDGGGQPKGRNAGLPEKIVRFYPAGDGSVIASHPHLFAMKIDCHCKP